MSASAPRISVVIPLYNKEDYIERCICSVKDQSLRPFEIIVVNDGSLDDGPEIARGLIRDDDIFIDQANRGVSSARNRGIAASSGELIAFIDADDEWLSDHLANIAELAALFPEAGLYGTGYQRLPPGLRITVTYASESPTLVNLFRASQKGGLLTASSLAVRAEAIRDHGGFRTSAAIGEDVEFWNRIALKWPLAFHPQATAIYHHSHNSAVASIKNHCTGHFVTIGSLIHSLKTGEVPEDITDDVRLWIAHAMLRYARSCIGRGRVRGARRALSHEYLQETELSGVAHALAAAVRVFPPSMISAYYRLRNSRWLTPRVQEHGGRVVHMTRRQGDRL